MTSRYFRCRTCQQKIHADASAVTCPSCGDGTSRIGKDQVSATRDRIIFLRSGTDQDRDTMTGLLDAIGHDAEWISAATLAVADGRLTKDECRRLMAMLRRRLAEIRPLVALLEVQGADATPDPVPTDLDDLDGRDEDGEQATLKETLAGFGIIMLGFAALVGVSYVFIRAMGWL